MNEDSEDVDRIARRIFDERIRDLKCQPGFEGVGWHSLDDAARDELRRQARHALEAIRQPLPPGVDRLTWVALAIQNAIYNGGFLVLEDGWVLCKHKAPDALTDQERDEIIGRLLSARPEVET